VVFVDQNNSVTKVSSMEVHGPSPQENWFGQGCWSIQVYGFTSMLFT
jgi:hypothetical protein